MTRRSGDDGTEMAEIVSFEERARSLGQGSKQPEDDDGDPDDSAELADLVREVTFRRLAELVRSSEPVPSSVVEAARESFAWRSIDDELARLVYDSALDDELLARARGAAPVRLLTFEASDIALEVEVVEGRRRSLSCQVVPPQAAELEVRHREGLISLGRDELGMFHMTTLPDGPVSLRCVPEESTVGPAATSWVTL